MLKGRCYEYNMKWSEKTFVSSTWDEYWKRKYELKWKKFDFLRLLVHSHMSSNKTKMANTSLERFSSTQRKMGGGKVTDSKRTNLLLIMFGDWNRKFENDIWILSGFQKNHWFNILQRSQMVLEFLTSEL